MLALELGVLAILIVVNGLLAMSELAIVSSRPARLAALVEKGASGSRRARTSSSQMCPAGVTNASRIRASPVK